MKVQVKSPNGAWCTVYANVTKDFASTFIKYLEAHGLECRAI